LQTLPQTKEKKGKKQRKEKNMSEKEQKRELTVEQDESNTILCEDCMSRDELISAKEVCDRTGWDLTRVYQMARSGEIPGAVWGETLHFKLEEFTKWWSSDVDKALRELEEEGLITSSVDPNGERRYRATEFVH
jgi:excisionase family DNA binding protein